MHSPWKEQRHQEASGRKPAYEVCERAVFHSSEEKTVLEGELWKKLTYTCVLDDPGVAPTTVVFPRRYYPSFET